MRVVITGGAGFLGSHLADALIARGDEVAAFDNFSTGRFENISHLIPGDSISDPGFFRLYERNVCDGLHVEGPVEVVVHMASPASPPAYTRLAVETLRVGSLGTENALKLASRKSARFILASTSEVYGDPEVHPQIESYWGHVNPIGPRSCYDESKRYAEAITAAYSRDRGVDVGIARIFNTYGPRMAADDGRVITNFICQALRGEPLTIYGSGEQTRSFCYVTDLVAGLVKLIDSKITGPVNIGNPSEFTVNELAYKVEQLIGYTGRSCKRLPGDDPRQRCPDISMARSALDWAPQVDLDLGLLRTAEWFRWRPQELGLVDVV